MEYIPLILFALGFLGTLNAFCLSFYCIFTKRFTQPSSQAFGIFLLFISLRILKSLLYAYSPEEPVQILQTGPGFFLLIGPSLLNYIWSMKLNTNIQLKYYYLHLIVWSMVAFSLMFFIPLSENLALVKGTLLTLINLQWLLYILLSISIVLRSMPSLKITNIQDSWMFTLLTGVLVIWMSCFFIRFEFFYMPSIIYSMIFYGIFIYFLGNKKKAYQIFISKNSPSESSQFDEINLKRVRAYMENRSPYKKSNLKLQDVAIALSINSHELSRIINSYLEINFNEFINQYRIEASKTLLLKDKLLTIEGISVEVGFKSKSAFYKAFKKNVGSTPTQFRQVSCSQL